MRLRQVFVICRHGDRTPLMNLARGLSLEKEEEQLWKDKILSHEQSKFLQESFPSVAIQEGLRSESVWGTLTQKGSKESTSLGSKLRSKYHESLEFLSLSRAHEVVALGTKYLRTQQTAQSILSGLYNITDGVMGRDTPEGVYNDYHPTVQYKQPHECQLNIYDDRLKELMSTVSKRAEYLSQVHRFDVFKTELLKHFPSLHGNEHFYLIAADHFYCRRNHGIDSFVSNSSALSESLEKLTTWMYSHYYWDSDILSHTTRGMMRDMISLMQVKLKEDADSGSGHPKLILWSAHDTTLMSLLHLFLATDDHVLEWPHYNDAILVELYSSTGVEEGARIQVLYKEKSILETSLVNFTQLMYHPHSRREGI